MIHDPMSLLFIGFVAGLSVYWIIDHLRARWERNGAHIPPRPLPPRHKAPDPNKAMG